MTKPLLSALPDFNRKEQTHEFVCQESGYNECMDDLSKYSFSEEELAELIYSKNHRINLLESRILAKELLSSLPLWLRKDVK